MKLLIGIVNSDDANELLNEMNKASFQATKLSTSGGFLKTGNVTFLVGVEEE
ncbi:MAG: cyclic-di-AMP receptor, partial [Clostridia bacterium]|nr:cyclic-di-AMP receptor [Clostridia bacterium]